MGGSPCLVLANIQLATGLTLWCACVVHAPQQSLYHVTANSSSLAQLATTVLANSSCQQQQRQ